MKKEKKLIVTFNTTTRAIAAEQALEAKGRDGKLGSIPGSIQAGCGLAWIGAPDLKEQVEKDLTDAGVEWHEMHIQEV